MASMMACGHASQGTDGEGNPVCVICVIAGPGDPARTVVEPPDLTGRKMRCSYAMPGQEYHSPTAGQYAGRQFLSTRDSSHQAAFFKHHPEKDEDTYYCGCWGWD